MNDTYKYHGSQRVKVLQTNRITSVVQVCGMPPYNACNNELTPDIPVIDTKTTSEPCCLSVETKKVVLVSGVPIENISLEHLYDMIRREEEAIHNLSNVKMKPLSLVKQIDDRANTIAKLVQAMNETFK